MGEKPTTWLVLDRSPGLQPWPLQHRCRLGNRVNVASNFARSHLGVQDVFVLLDV